MKESWQVIHFWMLTRKFLHMMIVRRLKSAREWKNKFIIFNFDKNELIWRLEMHWKSCFIMKNTLKQIHAFNSLDYLSSFFICCVNARWFWLFQKGNTIKSHLFCTLLCDAIYNIEVSLYHNICTKGEFISSWTYEKLFNL